MTATFTTIFKAKDGHWLKLSKREQQDFLNTLHDFLTFPISMIDGDQRKVIAFKYSKTLNVTIDYTGNGMYRKRTLRSNENIGLCLKEVKVGATGLLLCLDPADEQSAHKVSENANWHIEMPLKQLLEQHCNEANNYHHSVASFEDNCGKDVVSYWRLALEKLDAVYGAAKDDGLFETKNPYLVLQNVMHSIFEIFGQELIATMASVNATEVANLMIAKLLDEKTLEDQVYQSYKIVLDELQGKAIQKVKEAMHIVYHDIIEEFGDFS